MIVELVVSAFVLIGAAFTLVGGIGIARLPDLYSRLHGPTKSTTLGVGATLVASAVWFSATNAEPSFHELLVAAFLFLTAPVSAHLVVKAALHMRLPNVSGAPAGDAPRPGEDRGSAVREETGGSPS